MTLIRMEWFKMMNTNEMQVINNNGEEIVVISTRGVAEMMGIRHQQVIEKLDGTKDGRVKGIITVLTDHNFVVSDY